MGLEFTENSDGWISLVSGLLWRGRRRRLLSSRVDLAARGARRPAGRPSTHHFVDAALRGDAPRTNVTRAKSRPNWNLRSRWPPGHARRDDMRRFLRLFPVRPGASPWTKCATAVCLMLLAVS